MRREIRWPGRPVSLATGAAWDSPDIRSRFRSVMGVPWSPIAASLGLPYNTVVAMGVCPQGVSAMPPKTPPSLEVPKLVLVDLLASASSAARIVGHLDDRDDSTALQQLSESVDALV